MMTRSLMGSRVGRDRMAPPTSPASDVRGAREPGLVPVGEDLHQLTGLDPALHRLPRLDLEEVSVPFSKGAAKLSGQAEEPLVLLGEDVRGRQPRTKESRRAPRRRHAAPASPGRPRR